jgi:hypothetical protein
MGRVSVVIRTPTQGRGSAQGTIPTAARHRLSCHKTNAPKSLFLGVDGAFVMQSVK